MQTLEKRIPLTAAQYHVIEDRIRKVELLQTLIARNQSKVRKLIDSGSVRPHSDPARLIRGRAEIRRLFGLRQQVQQNPDSLDKTLAAMTDYVPPADL